jgi:hypothetical protein
MGISLAIGAFSFRDARSCGDWQVEMLFEFGLVKRLGY